MEITDFDQAQAALNRDTDYAGVQAGLSEIPALLARWGHLYADASYAVCTAKLARDQARASVYKAIRATIGPKLTEAGVDAEVILSISVREAEQALASAEHDKMNIKAMYDALTARGQMLMSLGANLRHENQLTR